MEKNMTTGRQKQFGISSSALKYVALITMLIDHFGASFLKLYMRVNNAYDQYLNFYNIVRYIGRISFPIFIFLLVEGLYHTKNIGKYLFRLLLFCFISEIPFDLAFFYKPFDWEHQNVFFTLLIGLSAIAIFKLLEETREKERVEEIYKKSRRGKNCGENRYKKWLKNPFVYYSLELVIGGAAMVLANFLHTDYKWAGVLAIITAYILKKYPHLQMWGVCIVLYFCSSTTEIYALFCIPFIRYYNGRRGDMPKWVPYIFYPAHLLILWGITSYISSL